MSHVSSNGERPSPLRFSDEERRAYDREISLSFTPTGAVKAELDLEDGDVDAALFWPDWTDQPIEAFGFSLPDEPSHWDGRSR